MLRERGEADRACVSRKLVNLLISFCSAQGLAPREGAFIMSAIMVSHYDKGAFYPTGKPALRSS